MVDTQVAPVMDASLLCRAEGGGAGGALCPSSSSESCCGEAADAWLSLYHKKRSKPVSKILGTRLMFQQWVAPNCAELHPAGMAGTVHILNIRVLP